MEKAWKESGERETQGVAGKGLAEVRIRRKLVWIHSGDDPLIVDRPKLRSTATFRSGGDSSSSSNSSSSSSSHSYQAEGTIETRPQDTRTRYRRELLERSRQENPSEIVQQPIWKIQRQEERGHQRAKSTAEEDSSSSSSSSSSSGSRGGVVTGAIPVGRAAERGGCRRSRDIS